MKSIRVSLIVYFLVLLAVAFGTASLLVYRTALDNLRAKQLADRELAERIFTEKKKNAEKEFDVRLEDLAKLAVGRSAVTRNQWDEQVLTILNLLGLGNMSKPQAHVSLPIWAAEAANFSPGALGSQ